MSSDKFCQGLIRGGDPGQALTWLLLVRSVLVVGLAVFSCMEPLQPHPLLHIVR